MAPKLSFCKILIPFLIYRSFAFSIDFNYPAIFNFGDSNSDTGGYVAGLAYHLYPPNGQTYFNGPSGRFCDGRLLLDFLTEAMDLPFLNPYLDAIGAPSFAQGCNFAVCGSSILPAIATYPSPYTLGPQVAQFFRFKARVLELQAKTKGLDKYLPVNDYFEKGLYMFDIGQNDITTALFRSSFDQVLAISIPTILSNFEVEVKNLYEQGARNFWIHNIGPLGCIPFIIDQFGTDPSNLDEVGCVIRHNQVVKYFNHQLQVLCSRLQDLYQDVMITCVDIFAIKHNLLADYATLGFEQRTMACCGYGGPPLNFEKRIDCGQTKILNGTLVTAGGCNDSSKYVNWDGIHYTEASNRYVSAQILSGKYFVPLSDRAIY